jgi:hypothetical protein
MAEAKLLKKIQLFQNHYLKLLSKDSDLGRVPFHCYSSSLAAMFSSIFFVPISTMLNVTKKDIRYHRSRRKPSFLENVFNHVFIN